jgi:hypothetical protein
MTHELRLRGSRLGRHRRGGRRSTGTHHQRQQPGQAEAAQMLKGILDMEVDSSFSLGL